MKQELDLLTKKWLLTSSLLAVLAFNFSWNDNKASSLDLSSETPTTTASIQVGKDSIYNAKYYNKGNGTTQVVLEAAAGDCNGVCGSYDVPMTIDPKNAKSILDINKVVIEKATKTKTDSVIEKCRNKSSDDLKAECFADELIALSKESGDDKAARVKVDALYTAFLSDYIKDGLKAGKKLAKSDEDADESDKEKYEATIEVITNLIDQLKDKNAKHIKSSLMNQINGVFTAKLSKLQRDEDFVTKDGFTRNGLLAMNDLYGQFTATHKIIARTLQDNFLEEKIKQAQRDSLAQYYLSKFKMPTENELNLFRINPNYIKVEAPLDVLPSELFNLRTRGAGMQRAGKLTLEDLLSPKVSSKTAQELAPTVGLFSNTESPNYRIMPAAYNNLTTSGRGRQ